ncbi:myelin-oligodendrocyte glycoprotein-like [Pholidichthys leucotaenia]
MNHKGLSLWMLLLCVYCAVGQNKILKDPKIITAELGKNVILPCRSATNKPVVVVEWNRDDLETDYVLLFKNGQRVRDYQYPLFMDRVELQDLQMKDGDLSLVLNDVMFTDNGTYKCYPNVQKTQNGKRENVTIEPISIVILRIVRPTGPPGGIQDGGKKNEYLGLIAGLIVIFVVLILVLIIMKRKGLCLFKHPYKKTTSSPEKMEEGAELEQHGGL